MSSSLWCRLQLSLAMPVRGILCLLVLFVSMLPTVATSVAAGEIYKWVDEKGRTRFSDQVSEDAGQSRAEKVVIRPDINTVKGADVSVSDYLRAVQQKRAEAKKQEAERQKPVVMYSAVWCGVCKRARQYFVANKIPFSEYDVETSDRGRKDYASLKGRGVPIILVGKQRMDGFSPGRFKQMYPH